jgi:hypothetical protein
LSLEDGDSMSLRSIKHKNWISCCNNVHKFALTYHSAMYLLHYSCGNLNPHTT